jgi:hypothetical protein
MRKKRYEIRLPQMPKNHDSLVRFQATLLEPFEQFEIYITH